MNIKKVVVVIPVHSSTPSNYELISFKQCFDVLGSHPIKILAPEGLELSEYYKVVPGFESVFIDPKWQSTLWKYNKLKTSRFFYSLFTEYQFLLTYELDAFVFKDELLFWCAKDYDYIGAPWFDGFIGDKGDKLIGVGNSGFSLRKIQPIENLLKDIYYKNPMKFEGKFTTRFKAHTTAPLYWVFNKISKYFGENYTIQQNFPFFEDIFFGIVASSYEKSFKVSPISDAIKFSFELKPELLFEINNDILPMGCHAWWRYSLNFWKPHIEKFGYNL